MKTLLCLPLVALSLSAQSRVIQANDAMVQYAPLPEASLSANLVQGLVGAQTAGGTGTPCVSPGVNGCFGTPPGTVVVQQNLLLPPNVGVTYYATFQTGQVRGGATVLFEIVEGGTVVQQTTVNGVAILPNSTILVGTGTGTPNNGYVGPATLTVTTTATLDGGATVTRKSSIGLRMIQ